MESKERRVSLEDRFNVDDEAMICNLLARRLTKEGYSCVTTHSGKEALLHFTKIVFPSLFPTLKCRRWMGLNF